MIRKYSEEIKDAARRLYLSGGKTLADIGRVLNVPVSTLGEWKSQDENTALSWNGCSMAEVSATGTQDDIPSNANIPEIAESLYQATRKVLAGHPKATELASLAGTLERLDVLRRRSIPRPGAQDESLTWELVNLIANGMLRWVFEAKGAGALMAEILDQVAFWWMIEGVWNVQAIVDRGAMALVELERQHPARYRFYSAEEGARGRMEYVAPDAPRHFIGLSDAAGEKILADAERILSGGGAPGQGADAKSCTGRGEATHAKIE